MNVRCSKSCRLKDRNGMCTATAFTITEDGCGVYVKAPEYEPFRVDNVVIYDKAGIPSIMVRFKRVKNKDLFGGLDRTHPAFIVKGKVYDEIYISKYPNVVINGKAYSLPMQQPTVNINFDEAIEACKSKGDGWHLWTAMERGLLIGICKMLDTLPHGNTNYGKWHGDSSEKGSVYDNCKTLTGSGPATWNHDHTAFGVSDLCGNIWEWFAGMRLMNGVLEVIPNNDAAANVDMSKDSNLWQALMYEDESICIDVEHGVRFTTGTESNEDYDGCRWEDVEFDFEPTEEMKELGLYCGEPSAYLYADTEGERLPVAGGLWYNGANAGVFSLHLAYPRSNSNGNVGFRSAFYGNLNSED